MPSTFLGLNTAYTGLQAFQASINTTAHNVSNTKTEGYSRQETNSSADRAIRTYSSYGCLGTGVVVNSIKQVRDEYYDIKYRNNQSRLGQYDTLETYMTQIEDYLDEYTLEGMTTEWNNFFSSLSELQKNPSDDTVRNNVINNAKSLSDYFNNLSTNLKNVQIDVNEEIKNQCDQVNTLAQNISELNKQINMLEVHGGNANDLRDQRNVLVDKLSNIINIETNEQFLGNGVTYYTVTANGQDLVANYTYYNLLTEAKTEFRNASDADGMYELTWSNGTTFNEYSTTLRGSLKALLDVRDGCNNALELNEVVTDENGDIQYDEDGNIMRKLVIEHEPVDTPNTDYKGIPYYQSMLNEFVNIFTSAVNEVFEKGMTTDGTPGVPMFKIQYADAPMSANSITVNDVLIQDVTRLATQYGEEGSWTDGESKYNLVTDLLALQSARVFNGGTGSYYLESIVTSVAIDSNKSTTFAQNFANIRNSIQNQRLSVMGVDGDEEGMDLMQYQQAYNLCSKILSVMTEVYDKLINQTGV